MGLISGKGKIPWRRIWTPTPALFLEKSHGQRSLVRPQRDTTEQAQALNAHLKATVQTLLSLLTSLCVHIGLMPESPGMGRVSGYPGLCVDRPLIQEKSSPLSMMMHTRKVS